MGARNDHKSIQNTQIHNPKDFETAASGSMIYKNLNDNYEWAAQYWQLPIIDLVDINSPPPTEVNGDRYILIEVASTIVDAGWDGAAINDIVEYSTTDTNWGALTPQEGFFTYDKDSNDLYKFDGSDWAVLSSGAATFDELTDTPANKTGDANKLVVVNVGETALEYTNDIVVKDPTPQFGGDMASNGNNLIMADNDDLRVGTTNNGIIYFDASDMYIEPKNTGTGDLLTCGNGSSFGVGVTAAQIDAVGHLRSTTVGSSTAMFQIEAEGTLTHNQFRFVVATGSANYRNIFQAKHSAGTVASPTDTAVSVKVFSIQNRAYTNSNYRVTGELMFETGAGFGTTDYSGKLYFRTVEAGTTNLQERFSIHDDGDIRMYNVGGLRIGTDAAPDTTLDIDGAFTFRELSADPSDPDEGASIIWMSDGTGSGDDGDTMMKITAGATTKTITLVDFSAA